MNYTDEMYWFARGYYDGRAIGTESDFRHLDDYYHAVYKAGYESGVTDHCAYDVPEDEA